MQNNFSCIGILSSSAASRSGVMFRALRLPLYSQYIVLLLRPQIGFWAHLPAALWAGEFWEFKHVHFSRSLSASGLEHGMLRVVSEVSWFSMFGVPAAPFFFFFTNREKEFCIFFAGKYPKLVSPHTLKVEALTAKITNFQLSGRWFPIHSVKETSLQEMPDWQRWINLPWCQQCFEVIPAALLMCQKRYPQSCNAGLQMKRN